MLQNSIVKQIQISEEALPPVHVPLIFGNECFIITQQDIRKIEDSRLITLSELCKNGNLKPLNMLPDTFLKLANLLNSQNFLNIQNLYDFIGLVNSKTNNCFQTQQQHQTCPQQNIQSYPQPYAQYQEFPSQPMEISYSDTRPVATIDQQLNWDKCNNTSAPFPMTYSQATSSTELNTTNPIFKVQQNIQKCCCCCSSCSNCRNDYKIKAVTFSKSTYTQDLENDCKKSIKSLGAREQLKQKKLKQYFA